MLGDAVVHDADASALTLGLEPGLARLRIPVRIRRNQVSEDQREVGHVFKGSPSEPLTRPTLAGQPVPSLTCRWMTPTVTSADPSGRSSMASG